MEALMPDRRPSAAQSLYPNLPSDDGRQAQWTQQRRDRSESVASAMYPRPKPPPKNPYLEGMTETEWRDQLWALAGLRRKR
jgi:hypothetical protein